MIATIIVLLIIAVVAVIAFRSYKDKLAHGCCGAGGGTVETKAEVKELEGPVIAERTVTIGGMTCVNCQNRIQKRLNKIEGVSAIVDYKTGKAQIKEDRQVSDNVIRAAILGLEYQVISIE